MLCQVVSTEAWLHNKERTQTQKLLCSPSPKYPKCNYQPKNEEIHQTRKKKVPFGTVFTIIYILKISNEQPSIKGIED